MKKIGFIDYFMSEWHSNHYPAMIRSACEKLGVEYTVAYAWSELDDSPDGKSCDAWCAEFGAVRCATLEEVCEKSDVLLVLCPGVPEKHLPYARRVLPYKKPTYIDKTFAPNAAEAEEIVSLARKYGTPMFSTSALRYGSELDELVGACNVITTGGGRSAEEYIVHQAEMIVKLLGTDILSVKAEAQGKQRIFRARFGGDRMATAVYDLSFPFAVTAELADGSKTRVINSDFFGTLIEKILHFYETGEVDFQNEETLAVMKLREKWLAADETWREI